MTYADDLSAAWADHLKPRQPGARTVVSLFAGCGGSSLGYSMAGYRELFAVEWDDHAAEIFRLNFPDVKLHHGDIADVDASAIRLSAGELDVLDGSPPCQGFSTASASNRAKGDSRNDLFRHYVRLLEIWQPKTFIMENVSGMIKGKMRLKFTEILAALKSAGYLVEVRLVDASLLGVPQRRQRLIFVGTRVNLIGLVPAFPLPSPRTLTVRDAWQDLNDTGERIKIDPSCRFAKLVALTLPGKQAGEALKASGRKPAYWGLSRLHYMRPAPTMTKTFRAKAGAGFLHPEEDRYITSRELTRLQSFPDEFNWGESNYVQIHARVGNSVPPLMMRAIATAVHRTLDRGDS